MAKTQRRSSTKPKYLELKKPRKPWKFIGMYCFSGRFEQRKLRVIARLNEAVLDIHDAIGEVKNAIVVGHDDHGMSVFLCELA